MSTHCRLFVLGIMWLLYYPYPNEMSGIICVFRSWFSNCCFKDVLCSQPHHVSTLFRLQAQPSNSSDAYKGMFDAFCRTFQHEGFRGFYRGLLPNLLKVVPAASITYMVYESMKKNLDLE